MINDSTIEQEIQAKGLVAPRVTTTAIEDEISVEYYFTALEGVMGAQYVRRSETQLSQIVGAEALGVLTFCVIRLRNGFTVTGESACASPENFDAELGQKIARQNAINKIWPLLGFRLRDQLARASAS